MKSEKIGARGQGGRMVILQRATEPTTQDLLILTRQLAPPIRQRADGMAGLEALYEKPNAPALREQLEDMFIYKIMYTGNI